MNTLLVRSPSEIFALEKDVHCVVLSSSKNVFDKFLKDLDDPALWWVVLIDAEVGGAVGDFRIVVDGDASENAFLLFEHLTECLDGVPGAWCVKTGEDNMGGVYCENIALGF